MPLFLKSFMENIFFGKRYSSSVRGVSCGKIREVVNVLIDISVPENCLCFVLMSVCLFVCFLDV